MIGVEFVLLSNLNYGQVCRIVAIFVLLVSGIGLITLAARSIYEPLGYLVLGVSLLTICIGEVFNNGS